MLEGVKRAEARPEVIERESAAKRRQLLREQARPVDVDDRFCLGDLEGERAWVDPGIANRRGDEVNDLAVADRDARQVDLQAELDAGRLAALEQVDRTG